MTEKLLKGKKSQDRSSKEEDPHVIYQEAVWEARDMPLSNGHAPFKTWLASGFPVGKEFTPYTQNSSHAHKTSYVQFKRI